MMKKGKLLLCDAKIRRSQFVRWSLSASLLAKQAVTERPTVGRGGDTSVHCLYIWECASQNWLRVRYWSRRIELQRCNILHSQAIPYGIDTNLASQKHRHTPAMPHPHRSTFLLRLLSLLLSVLLLLTATAATTSLATDRWGGAISTPPNPSPQAVAYFEEAVLSYAGLRGLVLEPLQQALELEPDYLMAHIYLAHILLLSTGVTREHLLVQQHYASAKQLISSPEISPREQLYFDALHALYAPPTPDFTLAAAIWEKVLEANPRELLAIRSAHDAYIILGDTVHLRGSLAHVLSRWNQTHTPTQDSAEANIQQEWLMINSMWAFALEENNDLHRAALVAREVLTTDPTDVTALHALAHTFEMASKKHAGQALYEEFAGQWEDLPSLFKNHVAWHRGVFYLEMEAHAEKALQVYDEFLVRDGDKTPPATPLAMADAASLLWRLSLKGVSEDLLRERWQTLRKFYAEGGYETAHITSFNDVHMLMCLAHVDLPAAHAALRSMRKLVGKGKKHRFMQWVKTHLSFLPKKGKQQQQQQGEWRSRRLLPEPSNAKVLEVVGLQVGEALIKFAEGKYQETVRLLSASAGEWQRIGGSHAQRDILSLTLIEACLRNETDLPLARRLLAERAAIKDPHDEEGVMSKLQDVEARLETVAVAAGESGATGDEL